MRNELIEVMNKAAHRDNRVDGDFIRDGIRICGTCGEPKQKRLVFETDGNKKAFPVTIMCRCEQREFTKEKDAEAKQKFDSIMTSMMASFPIADPAFQAYTFDRDDQRNQKVSDACRRYIVKWEKIRKENIGILFSGPVGTGKSFYGGCIINAALDRMIPAAATSFPRLLNLLQGTRDRIALLDHLQSFKLLLIDDLGVERDSAYGLETVFSIVDARDRAGLPTIFTTNLTVQEMQNPQTMMAGRIYDRVLAMAPATITLKGGSRRAEGVAARQALAQELLLGGQ